MAACGFNTCQVKVPVDSWSSIVCITVPYGVSAAACAPAASVRRRLADRSDNVEKCSKSSADSSCKAGV